MSSPRPVVAVAAVLLSLGLAGCTGAAGPTPTPTPAKADTTVEPTGDGVLRIGTVTDAAASGGAIVAGVELAVRAINDAGGYKGAPVEVYHRAPSDPAVLDGLAARGADAVIAGATVVLDAVPGIDLVTVTPVTAPDDALLAELRQTDPALTDYTGAADAYEATVAIVLAAVFADDDGGASIDASLEAVRTGDAKCGSFGECLAALEDGFTIAFAPRWS